MTRPNAGSRADDHERRLQALCTPGGPLRVDSPHATTRNPRWFTRDPTGLRPTRERRHLHNDLLAEFTARAPDVRRDHRAIILAGPPGAGKSTALASVIERLGSQPEHWRTIDADHFKDELLERALRDGAYAAELVPPEVAELQEAGERFWPRELASLVHDESALLARTATAHAVESSENVVIDGVLAHKGRARQLVEQLAATGYEIHVVDVEAPRDVVQQRVAARWRRDRLAAQAGQAPDARTARLGGRWVPSAVIADVYAGANGPARSEHVARALAETQPAVRSYSLYRVNDPAGAPQLVERRVRAAGSQVLVDEDTTRALRSAAANRPERRPGERSSPGRD